MPSLVDELEAQVLQLDAADRARLLERLLASFEPDSEIEKAWIDEALRREAEVVAGKIELVAGEEALARARARIS